MNEKEKILLKLQLKKAFKIYPTILIVTVITILSIGIMAITVLKENDTGENKQKLSVGIVGDLDETYFGIGINVLQNLDASRFFVDFPQMTLPEAEKALKNREINGFVHIPGDFVYGVYTGKNIPAKYIVLDGPEGLGTTLSKEVLQVISGLVKETQNGCYSFRELAESLGQKKGIGKKVNNMNYKYVEFILNRNNTYELELLGISNQLTMKGYFICGIILFFLLIWGISCNKLLTSKNLSLSRMLKKSGITISRQLLYEYLAFFAVTVLTMLLFAFGIGIVITRYHFGVGEFLNSNLVDCILFVFKILPAIIMLTAMHMALSELIPSTVSGIIAQLLIAVGLGYISGCFYPNFFFPQSVQQFASVLPSGCGFTLVRKAMAHILEIKDFVLPVLYTAIFAVITVFARKKAIKEGK